MMWIAWMIESRWLNHVYILGEEVMEERHSKYLFVLGTNLQSKQ
jgi:hypothetical protein